MRHQLNGMRPVLQPMSSRRKMRLTPRGEVEKLHFRRAVVQSGAVRLESRVLDIVSRKAGRWDWRARPPWWPPRCVLNSIRVGMPRMPNLAGVDWFSYGDVGHLRRRRTSGHGLQDGAIDLQGRPFGPVIHQHRDLGFRTSGSKLVVGDVLYCRTAHVPRMEDGVEDAGGLPEPLL